MHAFFEVDAQRVITVMKLTRVKDVTRKHDIPEDEKGVRAMEKAARKPRKLYSLFDANLSVGIFFITKKMRVLQRVQLRKRKLFLKKMKRV